MRRVDLLKETMQAWARLDEAQRHRFFQAFLSAAVRLDKLALRAGSGVGSESRRSPLRSIRPAGYLGMATLTLPSS
jgi:hypothetical protein